MFDVVRWYLLVSLFGWVAWPLAFRHLRHLPERGYILSRALGLLLVGYVFWLLASLGLVSNTPGAMLLAILVVAGVSIWQYVTRPNTAESLRGWLGENRRLVIAAETLFLLAFVAWTVVRAFDPALNTTEKPMELTFLNGIRQSEIFPPRDPWLAGYAISYYYFGYVMVALLADLTGTASAVAFNLAIGLLFALTTLGAYGVAYNFIGLRRAPDHQNETPDNRLIAGALLGPLFVAIMGNLAGALELLRALRLPRADAFWAWLDLADLNEPLQPDILWPPGSWRFWWWWRSSRVIHDRDLTGAPIGLQPIDEFPMFSFLLGDMHPHVLALPFVLLCLGLALNLAVSPADKPRGLPPTRFVLYALVVGSLGFLNAWDLPTYLFIIVGAETLRLLRGERRTASEVAGRVLVFGLGLLLLALGLYLPFYIGFSSQASGLLPNVIFPTRLPNFLVMFGPLLFIVGWFLARQLRERRSAEDSIRWVPGVGLAVGMLALLVGAMALGGVLALQEPFAEDYLLNAAGFNSQELEAGSPARATARAEAISMAVARRLAQSGVALLLTALLATSISALWRKREANSAFQPADFAVLLIATGALLTLVPEFVYVRDTFGQRLNTVFKFYYATWVLWGIAAAYATWDIGSNVQVSRPGRGAFVVLAGVLVTAGLVYPVLAIPAKVDFTSDPVLDGIAYIEEANAGDLEGIRWLQANAEPGAIVLEAIGGQYSYYGRVSTTTGLPTLLGWPGHQLQWRGSLDAAGTREADVKTIYSTPDMRTAQSLLDRYDVTYVFVGSLEQDFGTPAGIEKFERALTPVYENGDVTIYRADQPLPLEPE